MKEIPKSGKKRDLAKTREKILDAAASEFANKGLTGARVDDIAARAGVNKAMIYYVFGNKEELHLAVLESLFEDKTANLEAGLNLDDLGLPNLLSMLGQYFDALQHKREYARIMLDDLVTGASAMRTLRERRPDLFSFLDRISELIATLSENGRIKPVDPDKSVLTLIVLMVSLAAVQPHLDLIADPGSKRHQDISDLDQWKEFFAGLLVHSIWEKTSPKT